MNDHYEGGCGNWWVWIIVIVIFVILLGVVLYVFSDDTQFDFLVPTNNQTEKVFRDVNRVKFPPETVEASVRLSGEQQVPPVRTSGKGKGSVVISAEDKTVYYDIYAKKLSSDIDLDIGVHFHRGERGVNGPVLKDINIDESDDCKYYRFKGKWTSRDSRQPLTQKDLDDLLSGRIYIGVHTEKHPEGEIRGQINC